MHLYFLAPSGLHAPEVTANEATFISLSWTAPTNPNGNITQYLINRTRPSLISRFTQRDLGNAFYGTEYASFAPMPTLSGYTTSVSLSFKTLQPDGVLIYSINKANTDFVAIELRKGIPWFLFDSGSGSAAIATSGNTTYDDGKWHKLLATRTGKNGEISVDDSNTGIGSSLGTNSIIGALNKLSIGGLADDAVLNTVSANNPSNATLIGHNFAGCLFNIQLKDSTLNFSTLLNDNSGVGSSETGCLVNLETGVFFLGGGYIAMPCTATQKTISLNFKTSYPSGILLFHYGNNSHLLLSFEDSNLVLRVKGSGMDELLLTYNDITFSRDLCDGLWHYIEIIMKDDGIILQVDGQSTSNPVTNITFDTSSMLYLGGIPLSSTTEENFNVRFTVPVEGFSGCFKNLEINSIIMDLKKDHETSELVRFDGCDNSTDQNLQTCYKEAKVIDTELATKYIDIAVESFTGLQAEERIINLLAFF